MNYEILSPEHADQIRKRFEDVFLMRIDDYAKRNPAFYQYSNSKVLYSARLCDNATRLDFYSALGELSKATASVYFLGDPNNEQSELGSGFVARTADSKKFAKQIFDEWCREFYLGNNIYLAEFHTKTNYLFKEDMFVNILPFDIYIFDESMEWTLVFTHENCEHKQECDAPHDETIEPKRCCYLARKSHAI